MAWNPAHWTITRSNGNIRYIGPDHGIGGETYITVLELHRELQDFADNASSSGDDELDITDENPTNRSTDNYITLLGNYNIDDNAAEHIYDGSIVQGTGGTEVYYDGIVNYGNLDVQIQIIQDGAVLTDDWWNQAGAGLNADAAQGISHRFLMKTRAAGADIDGRRLVGITRVFNKTYGEFVINGTSRGNNVLALVNADDGNNETSAATLATWDQFTNANEGYIALDVNNDGSDEFYYSNWQIGGGATPASPTVNDLYEYWKYVTRDGSASTVYGISGELFRSITHEITVDTGNGGTWVEPEEVSWGTGGTAGTGQLIAVDNTTAASTTKMWIQLLTGVAPTDGLTISGATATNDVNVTVTPRPRVIASAFGSSTGTAISGAYGVGVDPTDLSQTDALIDLANAPWSPPNFVTFSVGGLVIGEDYVFIGPWDGITLDNESNPALDLTELTLNTSLTGGGETAVVTTTAIPGDTPNTGTIRVEMDDGRLRLLSYTSWTGSTFTIPSTSFTSDEATSGNAVAISYIDTLAGAVTETFTGVYSGDRDLLVKVRDGGGTPIKEYITSAVLSDTGGGVTAIRTSDL